MNLVERQIADEGKSSSVPGWGRFIASGSLVRWKQLAVGQSVVQRFEPEAVLLSGCSSGRKSFLVEEGVVALTHHLICGRQVFLTLRSAGQVFGHSRHVLGHSFEFSASALTPCVIRIFDSQWLLEQIRQGGEAGVLLMEQHAFDLYKSRADLIDLVHLDAGIRLERFLAQFAAAQGVSCAEEMCMSIPLTDGYLASLLGISAQQFSAVKRRLIAEGRVRYIRETREWIFTGPRHKTGSA
jgi:CRP-like cAMP-binding protein